MEILKILIIIAAYLIFACSSQDSPATCIGDIPLNIGFLIDESSSINSNEYPIMQNFIKRIIEYDINDISYITLFAYASASKFQQFVDFTSNKADIIHTIDKRSRLTGSTDTGDAITKSLTAFNAYNNNQRPDLLFVLTDGDSDDEVCDNVENLVKDSGVDIILIGIGDEINYDILRSDDYNCIYHDEIKDVYYFPDFDSGEFHAKEAEIRERMCKNTLINHQVVVGGRYWETHNSGNKLDECLFDANTNGEGSNAYGDHLAAQCCFDDIDGNLQSTRFFTPDQVARIPGATNYCKSEPDDGELNGNINGLYDADENNLCCYDVDYNTAKNLCESKGERLCTPAETKKDLAYGCSFHAFHIWTSSSCDPVLFHHQVVVGDTYWETHNSGNKLDECLFDADTNGKGFNAYGDHLAAQCCFDDIDGNLQSTRFFTPLEVALIPNGAEYCKSEPDDGELNGNSNGLKDADENNLCCYDVNYNTAKNLCEAKGERLCTADEAKKHLAYGCSFDAFHTWTSSSCSGSSSVGSIFLQVPYESPETTGVFNNIYSVTFGFVLFILINNLLCYWCLCNDKTGKYDQQYKL